MTVLHTGSTKKFSSNWESIFGKGSKKAAAKPAKKAASAAKTPAAKAQPGKKKRQARK